MTNGDHRDRWLSETLDDAVADVDPRHDLDGVRARIEEDATRTRARHRWAAAGAGLAVAATVATIAFATGLGVGDPTDEAVGPAASPSVGTEQAEPDESPEPSEEEHFTSFDGPLAVYYAGDTPTGPRLFREFRAPTAERGDALAMAVQMAVDVPPTDPDYRIPWPEGMEAAATYEDDLLTVDLSAPSVDVELVDRPSSMSRDEARMALEQLIHTAQAAVQDRAPVRFLLDGETTDRVLGEPTSEPLAEGDPMEVQAPVWVISPQDGTVTNTVQVEGRGAFFEANVSWQVLQGGPDGRVVKEGYATAEECCTLSPYSFEVTGLEPGDYVLRVYDADVSGGEGFGEHEDTKRFTLTG